MKRFRFPFTLIAVGFAFSLIACNPGPNPNPPTPSPSPSATASTTAISQRVVAGVIKRDGAVISGSGFSVLHQGGGNYLISFNAPFSRVPSVHVGHVWSLDPNNSGGSIYDTASVAGVNGQQLRVRTGYLQGLTQNVEDRDFSFIAVGE